MSRPNPEALTKERGQSVVEVAVLIPVLLLILLGVLDLGRGFFAYVTVSNAARGGARYASMHPSATQDVVNQQVGAEMGSTLELGPNGSLISVERSSLSITDTVTVTVHYSFTTFFLGPVSGFVASFWGGPRIPNPILVTARSVIPISSGVYRADQAAATASAISAATATALGSPTATPSKTPTITPTPTGAWISLSSYYAFSGDSLSIRGCGFHNNKTVTIYWDGVARWSASTDNTGCFGPSSFTVPTSAAGSSHTVSASSTSGSQTLAATANPDVQIVATPTASPTSTNTGTSTATPTSTQTSTRTSTATATPIPIILNIMRDEDDHVSGTAAPGATIEIRDFTRPGRPVIGTGVVAADGTFNIAVSPRLVVGHEIVLSATNSAVATGIVQPDNSTVTPTSTATVPATQTATRTSTPSPTPPTPAACTGSGISGSIYDPDGSSSRDATVSLIMDGQIINSLVTSGNGNYSFSADFGTSPLQGNRSYLVKASKTGYTSNWTTVYLPCGQSVSGANIYLGASTPTATATSAPLQPPTLSASCTLSSGNYYHSLSWTSVSGAVNYYVYHYNSSIGSWSWVGTTSSTSLNVSASANSIGQYYVTAVNANHVQSYPSNVAMAVCGNTPTPTVTPLATNTPVPTSTPYVDLVPYQIEISPDPYNVVAGQLVTVTVSFSNQGTNPANRLFWVDLYVDPSPAPPDLNQSGIAWQAVSSMPARSVGAVVFHMAFPTSGLHFLYSQVDSTNTVAEAYENNNVSNAYGIWVNAAPTMTPVATATETSTPVEWPTATITPVESPTPAPSATATATATNTPAPGSVSGDTYIWANGSFVLQGRVGVYLYNGATLVASGSSDSQGHYQLTGVPPGTYTLIAMVEVNLTTYYDVRNIRISSGVDTSNMDLFLAP